MASCISLLNWRAWFRPTIPCQISALSVGPYTVAHAAWTKNKRQNRQKNRDFHQIFQRLGARAPVSPFHDQDQTLAWENGSMVYCTTPNFTVIGEYRGPMGQSAITVNLAIFVITEGLLYPLDRLWPNLALSITPIDYAYVPNFIWINAFCRPWGPKTPKFTVFSTLSICGGAIKRRKEKVIYIGL